MSRICFPLPSGQRVCISIPLLISRQWQDPNPPDPLTGGPLPDPWISGVDVKPDFSRDLQALASIHALSALLTEGPQRAIRESVRKQIAGLSHPRGMEVHLDGEGDAKSAP